MNISRATLRRALENLAHQELVAQRRGVGTLVTKLPKITKPMDRAIGFQQLIEDFCYTPCEQIFSRPKC